jgi:hypothetical protein
MLPTHLAPYSLGKLIDWKREVCYVSLGKFPHQPPYSLGKLIDWKLNFKGAPELSRMIRLPTR